MSWALRQGEIVTFGDDAKAQSADWKYLSAIHFVNSRFGAMAGVLTKILTYSNGRDFTQYRGHALLITRDGGNT